MGEGKKHEKKKKIRRKEKEGEDKHNERRRGRRPLDGEIKSQGEMHYMTG